MKLLFDQNISFRIVNQTKHIFADCKQVRELKLENSTDIDIWEYAKRNDYCIVTFDSDFIDIATLHGAPPKVIWLRLGNTSTQSIARVLIAERPSIIEFLSSPDVTFLEIYKRDE